MKASREALIVGAGIIGAACAAELHSAGFAVTVVDANVPAGGATAAGMGHVVVMDDSPAQMQLTKHSRLLWRALEAELPARSELARSGTLWVAADDEEMHAVESKFRYYSAEGVRAEILDQHALRRCEPALRPDLIGALRIPDDLVIYPPCTTTWLLERARARLELGVPVAAVEASRVRLCDQRVLEADLVVLAAGEATLGLLPQALPSMTIKPRKGHLVITDRVPGMVQHQLVELGYLKSAHSHDGSSVAFNLQPRQNGQLLVGSSRQYDRHTDEVEPMMLRRMLERAFHYMPALRNIAALRAWTGRRAATADHLPLIGRSHADGPWIAAGHEGLGITTSLGTARLLRQLILGEATSFDARPFDPQRLAEPAHA